MRLGDVASQLMWHAEDLRVSAVSDASRLLDLCVDMIKELHIRPKDGFCPVLRGCLALRNISELSLKKLLMTGNRKWPNLVCLQRNGQTTALWTNSARFLSPHFIFPDTDRQRAERAERPSSDGAGSIIQKRFPDNGQTNTVRPAVVTSTQLRRNTTSSISTFVRATHPPWAGGLGGLV